MTKVVRAEVKAKDEVEAAGEVKVEAGVETADKHVDKHVDKDLMRKHLMCKNWRSKSPILKDLSKGLTPGRIPRSGHARARGKKKITTMHQFWNLYTMVTATTAPLLAPFQDPLQNLLLLLLLFLRFLHFPVQQESKQATTATTATMATTVTLATIFNTATAWTVLTRTVSFDFRIMGRNPCRISDRDWDTTKHCTHRPSLFPPLFPMDLMRVACVQVDLMRVASMRVASMRVGLMRVA